MCRSYFLYLFRRKHSNHACELSLSQTHPRPHLSATQYSILVQPLDCALYFLSIDLKLHPLSYCSCVSFAWFVQRCMCELNMCMHDCVHVRASVGAYEREQYLRLSCGWSSWMRCAQSWARAGRWGSWPGGSGSACARCIGTWSPGSRSGPWEEPRGCSTWGPERKHCIYR